MTGSRWTERLGMPKLDGESRRKALADPGPSWREWALFDLAKVWALLCFFVIDTLIVASFLRPFQPAILLGATALALYLEFLAYEALWYRPHSRGRSVREPFRRTWYRPVAFGRWTPAGERVRKGLTAFPEDPGEGAPDPLEFL